jgi:hypothetical protein
VLEVTIKLLPGFGSRVNLVEVIVSAKVKQKKKQNVNRKI